MKDVKRLESLILAMHQEMHQRFDSFNELDSRLSKLEAGFAAMKPLVERIPFIERKLDQIKTVTGEHSTELLRHDLRIRKLEQRR